MDAKQELAMKRANARGFINHIVTNTGATTEQAAVLFKKSNDKAIRIQKRANLIADAILEDANERFGLSNYASSYGLPLNLQSAISS